MQKVFAVVGKKGAGRSEVLLALVENLKSRGRRVGVVRHLKRDDLEIDQPGKDTYAYRMHGAEKVILSGRKRCAIFENRNEEFSIPELLQTFQGYDFVFLEEYFLPGVTTLEVQMQVAGDLIFSNAHSLIAICSDSLRREGVKEMPVFSSQQINPLVDFLEQFEEISKTGAQQC